MTIASALPATRVGLAQNHLTVAVADQQLKFHYVWLRDNCWCDECRVVQSGERRLYTATIPADIAPTDAYQDGEETLHVRWNDGHTSMYVGPWLTRYEYSTGTGAANARRKPVLWAADGEIPTFEHDDVVGSPQVQLAYLHAVRDYGAAVVRNVPSVDGEVERFAEKIGHVRETAFERVHNVRHDPAGYNVAHTALELKPHTDMPSYHWPPSIQLLHFLVNESTGGETTLTDGFAILADLKKNDRSAFETLARIPVTYQLFSQDEDTYARAPMIILDAAGEVSLFRFSNQLAQPVDAPFEDVEEFYRAYRLLGAMIDSAAYQLAFKTRSGDLLTVHGHRVMHGRKAFDPASGGRHLQDVYMEFDDLIDRARVLAGVHLPLSATGRKV